MIVDFNSETWTDPWFRKLSLTEKLLFLYLWTNSHRNVAGLYALDFETMAFETGIDSEQVEQALDALHPKVQYDPEKNMVWILNHVKHQFYKTGKLSPKIAASIIKNLIAIAPHPFVDQFQRHYPTVTHTLSEIPDTLSGYPISNPGYSPGASEDAGAGKGEEKGSGQGERKKGKEEKKNISPSWDQIQKKEPF